MKYFYYIFLAFMVFSCKENKQNEPNNPTPVHSEHGTTMEDEGDSTKKKTLSPHTSAMVMIGEAHIHIDYSSPGVRDRIIFGGLLPYNAVWQTGAHMATWIETNKDLEFDGQLLKAGKYGFFTIPGKEEWTIIFNSNWDQHGKDEYNETEDILRFKVTPKITDNFKEHLEYQITKTNNSEGNISLAWEKVNVSFPFKIKL
ncbi:DUF2911 domain-containing protein [Flavobacteriaceae bacterium KMM 6897]|nr:DUF2911 domain-containing protein [Flavobacteriaceae bacterium KMM 6897]MEB8344496.1 DUF2911 domain-containing protein [Flavobacteriaceae bacterium KMM 6898]